MIYDAIAAGDLNVITDRVDISRKYLKGELLDKDRPSKVKHEIPKKVYDDWDALAIPSTSDLKAFVSSISKAWAIQFTFTLATPYMSKSIEAFDLLDNPIIRDKVYEVPIIPASSWKGGLRSAATIIAMEERKVSLQDVAKDKRIIRLFGNEREQNDNFSAGRLHCFPTGFKNTTCEVINPHDRARRVGTIPILLECVPVDQDGTFTILYVPFGDSNIQESFDDLDLCAKAITSLLTVWGIGAKKSNGNGLAKDSLKDLHIEPREKKSLETGSQKPKKQQSLKSLSALSTFSQQQNFQEIITFEQFQIQVKKSAQLFQGGK